MGITAAETDLEKEGQSREARGWKTEAGACSEQSQTITAAPIEFDSVGKRLDVGYSDMHDGLRVVRGKGRPLRNTE